MVSDWLRQPTAPKSPLCFGMPSHRHAPDCVRLRESLCRLSVRQLVMGKVHGLASVLCSQVPLWSTVSLCGPRRDHMVNFRCTAKWNHLEGLDLFDQVVTGALVRKRVCCWGRRGEERANWLWVGKGPDSVLEGMGIVEQENRYVVQSNLSSLYCCCMYIPPSPWLPYMSFAEKKKSSLWFYELGSITNVYACSRRLNMCAIEHERLTHYYKGWITICVVLVVVLRNTSWFCNNILLAALRRMLLSRFPRRYGVFIYTVLKNRMVLCVSSSHFLHCRWISSSPAWIM